MIATDVASRGIGMIEKTPLPTPLPLSLDAYFHLLLRLAEMSLAIARDLIRILISNSVRFFLLYPGPHPGSYTCGGVLRSSDASIQDKLRSHLDLGL
jgi:hypothetical protein